MDIAKRNGGYAVAAIDAVNFNNQLRNSMEFVFSNFMIVSSPDVAKAIVKGPIPSRIKCVTLDGDIHDPSGILTGGYVDKNNMILTRYEDFKNL